MERPSTRTAVLACLAGTLAMGSGCGLADRAQTLASSLIGTVGASESVPGQTAVPVETPVSSNGQVPTSSADASVHGDVPDRADSTPPTAAANTTPAAAPAEAPAEALAEVVGPEVVASSAASSAPTALSTANAEATAGSHAGAGPCIAGNWTLDGTPWLTAAVRRQAQGRSPTPRGTPTGVLSLDVDLQAGTVSLDADRFRIRHHATLAGTHVRYATRIDGQAHAQVIAASDEMLELKSTRRLRALMRVDFNGKESTHRSVALPFFGTLIVDCNDDTLSLTPMQGLRRALIFRRSPKTGA